MTANIAAQLICFNPGGAALTPDEEAFIADHRIASFVLFARNLPDLESACALIARLHELAEDPLIAVDQEGGRVVRLPPPAAHLPAAMALGAAGQSALAFRAGQVTARELRALRLNAALAPVLDVNNNPRNPVIGTRSFGADPASVAALGVAWLTGAQGAGIAACAKHFPGHGDTHVDSHADLPRIEGDRVRLAQIELAPFRAAVAAGVEMVMPGHLLLPALDPDRPASLSRRIVGGLLRGEMGFEGVVITDALDMDAVAATYGIPGAATEAAIAGCDLVVPIAQHAETLAALQAAIGEGRLPSAQAQASAERVRGLRSRVRAPAAFDAASLGAPDHLALAREIAAGALGRRAQDEQGARDAGGLLPLRDRRGWVLLEFALGKATIAEGTVRGAGKLGEALRARLPDLRALALPYDPGAAARDTARALAADATGLIVAVRQALHFPAQQALAREWLASGKPVVLIAMRDPYDLRLFPDALCTLAAFDDSPAMVEATLRAVLGDA